MARVLADAEVEEIEGLLKEIRRIAKAVNEDNTISPYHALQDVISLTFKVDQVLEVTGK